MTSDAIVKFRTYLSTLSLMATRSIMLKLLEFVTDLDIVPSRFLEVETPSLSLLQAAVVDIVKSYSRRLGNFLFLYYSVIIFPFSMSHSDSDLSISFVDDSFSTWFISAKDMVSNALLVFTRNFAGYSVKHADFESITSLVNPCFLPKIELEVAFFRYLTFTEPCTLDKP